MRRLSIYFYDTSFPKSFLDNNLEGLNPQSKSPIKSPPSAMSSDKSKEGITKQGTEILY